MAAHETGISSIRIFARNKTALIEFLEKN